MEKDFRIRCDLCFPPEHEGVVRALVTHLQNQMDKAVNVNPDAEYAEIGFIDHERCGHRIGEPCKRIARWEVGRGQVYP